MAKSFSSDNIAKLVALLCLVIAAQIAAGQNTILRIQRSTAALNIDSNVKHGQGISGITVGNPGDVWRYPNSLSCLLVYPDGRYVLEKRDEETVGRPKT